MRTMKFVVAAAAAAATVSLTACGGGAAPAAAPAPAAPAAAPAASAPSMAPSGSAMAPSGSAMAAGREFGAGCAAVPTDASNPGSFTAMAKEPVATAASGNPVLSTLVTAVQKANLVDSLNSAQGITVFAPANSAFEKIPANTLNGVLNDDAMLKTVLTYHVVPGRLSPEQLAGTHKTLQGQDLTVTGSGTDYTVNGNSSVVCGNVQTENATVYIVDSVLMPKS
jgi:uncharacterized surface protein with fasciclin (FAS1) repeats